MSEQTPNLPACLLASNVLIFAESWLATEFAHEKLGEICGRLCKEGRMDMSKATAIYRLSKQLNAGQISKLIENIIRKQGAV